MKDKTDQTPEELLAAARCLYEGFASLTSAEECEQFLGDLCTPAELQALVDRWTVVRMLRQGLPYREIQDRTGVSVTTVGRVARFLANGSGGYQLVVERMRL